PLGTQDVNTTGSLNVLEEARRRKVQRFIYCSSSEVYGNASSDLLEEDSIVCRPVTVYGAAKLAGEHYACAYHETYGLPIVIVRPFNAYGPRAHDRGDLAEVIPRFVIRVLNGLAPVIFGDGSNGRDFTYVTEVAHGIRLADTCDRLVGSRINIAYGRMVSVREVAMLVMNACGRNELAVEFAHPRPGDVHILRADTGRAAEQLGYRAKIPIEEGIRRYLHWFRSRHPDPATLVEADVKNWRMPRR